MSFKQLPYMTSEHRKALELDTLRRAEVSAVYSFSAELIKNDKENGKHISYFLDNCGLAFARAKPHSGNLVDVETRLMSPEDSSELKMRQAYAAILKLVHGLVYKTTPIGDSQDAAFVFTRDNGEKKQVLVKVERMEQHRYNTMVLCLKESVANFVPRSEATCDEDPQPGCPMEEVS
jgi:hypothetical protein